EGLFQVISRKLKESQNYNDRVVIMSFVSCISVFIFFIIMSYLTLQMTKTMISIIKNRENEVTIERDESLRMLNVIEVYTKMSVVRKLQEGVDPTQLPPEKKDLAILFCDIRDFTKISENLEPIKVLEILNPYFAMMNEVIIEFNGEIDKLMGDCIMAIFESPDDAVKAAIGMRDYIKQNKLDLVNGIGIHYGSVITGNIGSPWKLDYTVIGDVVNVASRLEALTKIYNAGIVISDAVKEKLTAKYNLIDLDMIMVKGRSTPIKIFGIYDDISLIPSKIIYKFKSKLKLAFKYYVEGDFEKSLKIYNSISKYIDQEKYPSFSHLEFYKGRCIELIKKKRRGEVKNWNGIYDFSGKKWNLM
ncbi:MAG TPA: adenylate/guanylate cyclase domain-containing protein, partial [Spirochaetota bacterium]|nr:adenylate/guanylate cyclase domain-containing protein [Spirochaetota bacterium]